MFEARLWKVQIELNWTGHLGTFNVDLNVGIGTCHKIQQVIE